jgi:hypothetical protein
MAAGLVCGSPSANTGAHEAEAERIRTGHRLGTTVFSEAGLMAQDLPHSGGPDEPTAASSGGGVWLRHLIFPSNLNHSGVT